MTCRLRTAAITGALLLTSTLFAQDPPGAAAPPKGEEQARAKPIEFAEMFWAIASGAMMDGNGGWFHPSETRYGFEWLAARFDADKDGKVARQEFKGPPELFARLDRNKDQSVTADDLDWSSRSAFARAAMPSNQWFRMFDGNSNGKISAEEWQALFNRASKGKGYILAEDLRDTFPTTPPPRPPGAPARPPDYPSQKTLMKGLLNGELGSSHEGPGIGDDAPDFTLKTHDGKRQIRLADSRGKKPVVLIFGSFT